MALPYQMVPPLRDGQARDNTVAGDEPCFDALKFMNQIGSAVPMEMVARLQKEFGTDLVGAVDKYHDLMNNKSPAGSHGAEAKVSGAQVKDEDGHKALCYRDLYWDKTTRKWTFKRTAKVSRSSRYNEYILFVKRIYSEKMVYSHTVVDVKGSILRNALQNIFRGCAGFALTDENTEVPESFFFWAKPELELVAEDLEKRADRRSLFEIKAALQFIEEQWSATTPALDAMLRNHDSSGSKKITFCYLWAILPPDVLVLGKDMFGEFRVYRVREHAVRRLQDGSQQLELHAEYVDYNGDQIGQAREVLPIPEFSGAENIDDLPYAPLHLHSKSRSIRRDILARNKKQLNYCTRDFKLRAHTGHGLAEMQDEDGRPALRKFNFHGRVIIDPAILELVHPMNVVVPRLRSFRQWGRVHATSLGTTIDTHDVIHRILAPANLTVTKGNISDNSDPCISDSDDDSTNARAVSAQELSIEETLMLSGTLYGWALGDARWGAFSITRVREFEWDDSIFHSLVMDLELKKLMFELIKAHASGKSDFDDFVRGKGQGLIGLFFGEPGLGKTLTAEAIAEAAHMPLYTVSSGALGSNAGAINANLNRILELTTHWKAVLLIDEADVFLAQRTAEDIQRNAIVSVFLRELEYYPGILILTTNQASIIDPAFRSRIHFCHQYPKLDYHAQALIWKNFIRRVRDSKAVEVDIDDSGIEKLAEMDLNGRQIKNVISIAVKLATRSDARCVSTNSIVAAAKSLRNFNAMIAADQEVQNSASIHPTDPDGGLRRVGGRRRPVGWVIT